MLNSDKIIKALKENGTIFFGLKKMTFDMLVSFLYGYDYCYREEHGFVYPSMKYKLMPGFREFLREYYNEKDERLRWEEMIRKYSDSDDKAVENFYKLYDIYRKLPAIKRDTLYCHINHLRQMKDFECFSRFTELLEFDFPWFVSEKGEVAADSAFADFGKFVRAELKYTNQDYSWVKAIKRSSQNDKFALKLFYRLYDKYCEQMMFLNCQSL